VAYVIASIKGLGLEVSLEKTEALWFCRKSSHRHLRRDSK
jgi:hypothetical protein